VLDLSLWIPDVLNDVFVAGLPGLVSVYQQWSLVTLSSVCACFGLPLPLPSVGAFCQARLEGGKGGKVFPGPATFGEPRRR